MWRGGDRGGGSMVGGGVVVWRWWVLWLGEKRSERRGWFSVVCRGGEW